MTDEKFAFTQDVREKKITARSARHARTHCGKGGAVKFPSDYMTKKELREMNGDVKSYRLNDPMKWDEFNALPDDLKITYIKALRRKFNVPDNHIGHMFGVSQRKISLHLLDLGCAAGKGAKGRSTKWDKEGFLAWCNGDPAPACPDEPVEASPEPVEMAVDNVEDISEPVPAPVPEIKPLPAQEEKAKVIPHSGTMTLEGRLEDVLNTVSVLLGGGKCKPLYFLGSTPGRRAV